MLTTFFVLNPLIVYVFVGLFSLIMGSFLNVVIYRLPQMLQEEYQQNCQILLNLPTQNNQSINLCFPRSFCVNCKHIISAWENIPFISYLLLRGRCKQCQHRISWHYPLVEALCMGLSLFALFHFGFNVTFFLTLLFIWLMIPLFFIDLQHQILPDSLTLSLLWMGLIANTQSLFTTLPNAVLSAAGAYLFLWTLVKLFYILTKKNGMGHGDFKLFAAFGAWFGWTQLPLILLMSSLIGAVVGISFLKITGKSHNTPIPFGPFLCFSGLIALFYGPSINHWYLLSLW
jgi:leader peptidase (prepilin peptidase) / N-methyltransferase